MKRMMSAALICACLCHVNAGTLRFRGVYTDHMVFQQEQPIVLKGYAEQGAKIEAHLSGATENSKDTKNAAVVSDKDGKWTIELPTMKAGGPYEIEVTSGSDKVTLRDVMIGELWLCSGQSNMEMPVWGNNEWYRLTNGLDVASAANDPDLRICQINRTDGDKGPVEEPSLAKPWWQGWQKADNAEAVKPFSATAYFFGKALRKRLGVPVGIVASSWGGSQINPWIGNDPIPPVFYEGFGVLSNWISKVETAAGEISVEARKNWMKMDLDTKDWTKTSSFTLSSPSITWYRWTVELPDGAENVKFTSTGITDTDETWFDGSQIGAIGIDTPYHWAAKRDYPIASAKGGKHVVAVRCFNHAGPGGIENAKLVWKGGEIDLLEVEALTRTEAKPTKATGGRPWSPWNVPFRRGYGYEPVHYNGMIAPLESFRFRGAIWYQGCADAKSYRQYGEWQSQLVESWRRTFSRPDMAFICVQLAGNLRNTPPKPLTADEIAALEPSDDGFVSIRQVQEKFRELPNCECVTAADIGDAHDIHAKNKREVGERLAAAAENLCYGGKNGARGPQVVSAVRKGAAVEITFDSPIVLNGGKIGDKEFTLAGEDFKRVWARAELVGDRVIRVVSDAAQDRKPAGTDAAQDRKPAVAKPCFVDYGWNPWTPSMSLRNREGFPVFPFKRCVVEKSTISATDGLTGSVVSKDLFLAHRGMSEEAPENTPAAYEKAVRNGYGFECDIYVTTDGHIFSFHDPDLKRIAGINKLCSKCTWDEVKDLDVGKWKGPEWAGQHPSSFKDILALARDGRLIQIHVKTGPEIIPFIKKELAAQTNANRSNICFATSDREMAKTLSKELGYPVWLGYSARKKRDGTMPTAEDCIAALKYCNAAFVAHRMDPGFITPEYVAAVKKAGFGFNVWTCDNWSEGQSAVSCGVDSITSNRPKSVLEELMKFRFDAPVRSHVKLAVSENGEFTFSGIAEPGAEFELSLKPSGRHPKLSARTKAGEDGRWEAKVIGLVKGVAYDLHASGNGIDYRLKGLKIK